LLKICNKIVVIEKDHRLIPILNEKFKNDISKGKLTVIEEDILDFDIEKNGIDIKYRIIANIPYYITGQIIRKFLEANKKPISMTLLLQKEVAERILARDGKESLLSLSVKIFGKPSIVRTVGRGAFNPVPNVDSAVLNIEEISNKKLDGVDQDDFFKVIHAGFAHKRKQLLPNLSNLFNKDMVSQALIDLKINPKIRAEDVKLDDWIKITKKII
jgi:16S rRNA (adenine1518-N6/adenine1519-N6)-dimethyltransferase